MELRSWRYWAGLGMLAALYFGTGRLGLEINAVSRFATLVWPPTGISLAALLVFGYRLWPGIALGAFLVNMSIGADLSVGPRVLNAAGIGVGNTLEALVGAYLFRRWAGSGHSLDRLPEVLALILPAALLSTLISATIGVTSGWAGGVIASAAYGYTWRTWWVGDVLGDLVMAPLLLVWATRPIPRISFRHLPEAAALAASLLCVGLIVFGEGFNSGPQNMPLTFLTFPPLIWAALRFGQRGAATVTFAMSILAIAATARSLGPFAREPLSEGLLLLQSFMGVFAVTGLTLAAVVAERAQSERLVRESEARIRSVVNHVLDGIITIDEHGIVATWNPTAEKIFGYQADEVVGQNVKMLMPEPYHSEHDGYLANYLHTGQAKIIGIGREVTGRRKNGSTFPMDLAVSEFRLGERRFFTGIVRDITERQRLEQQSRQRVDELAETDRRKNEFLAMLSHELRNPLAPLRTSLHLMRTGDLEKADLEQARAIAERQVQHLVRMVDGLLDVSRITRGQIELRRENVDLAVIVAHAVETARPLIDARRHELSVTLPPEPVRLHADPMRLEQIVTNLLTNAAKYTEPGGRIGLTVECGGSEVVLRVRDTGIGIPRELLPNIFDLFMQGERSLDRSQGGLGIGLTLVRKLAELHGGQVQAVSAGPGQGSEFVVRLPVWIVVQDREAAEPKADKRPVPTAAPRRRVLIVEDNTDAAESLAAFLRLGGFDVCIAQDGPQALQVAPDYQPEVVLLDIGLPGMDGFEVAQRLRQQPGLEKALLVALTGYAQQEDRRRAYVAGFDHHLVKPVNPTDLETFLIQPPTSQPSLG